MMRMTHVSKPVLIGAVIASGLAIAGGVMLSRIPAPPETSNTNLNDVLATDTQNVPSISTGALNATYVIEGKPVTLHEGSGTETVAGSEATAVVTKVFSVAALGDLNGDGMNDAAVILTRDAGGSGTFFYVAAALTDGTTVTGTNAVLAGDRIAPQSTNIQDGVIVFNFAERGPGEPMTTPPSMGRSLLLKLTDGQLAETTPTE